ncbi:MAG: 16S rRNA (adenine(1518)-N(6)/adenine(1519)-N(6))-dimethyltransferase RsmA [Alphaproteobacteria bacterium]|nr:16S rRNA (adenine(1518)-N(6)/adenine(1519)-N(6))-dimethyltransferase RsmA [Alphaproteobacteria bacterium]
MSDTDVAARLAALPPLRAVIAEAGLSARKGLGQNFLLDLNLTGKIARAAAPLDQGTVIEIGPGPGGLTRALLAEGAAHLVAIEKDRRCVDALQPLIAAADGRLTLVEADALAVDFEALGPPPRRIVANLPYNVATPLLIGWLKRAELFETLVLMFQKEVAERITADPGDAAYGRLGVLTGWRAEARLLFTLPPRAFTPPPKVESAVVEVRPRVPAPEDCRIEDLERVTAAAFGQRRKMLRRSLKSLTPDAEALLAHAGVAPTKRAEELSIAEFATLARLSNSAPEERTT